MRDIKFRRWHIELEDMVYSTNIELFEIVEKYPQMYNVMQYTGLKDKNGKEIFEGDIITDESNNYLVIFLEGCFTMEIDDNYFILSNFSGTEVIGNIHQNKDLL